MRPAVGIVLALTASAAAAWADIPPPATAPPAAAPALNLTPRPTIWKFDDAGGVEHLQSGLLCPGVFRTYKRNQLIDYDGFGLDVSCNYLEPGVSDLTVYVTRRGGASLDEIRADAKHDLEQVGAPRHPQLISDTQATSAGLAWSVAIYAEDDAQHSGIWIADLDGWTLEYRATYSAAVETRVLGDIAAMTDLVQASAGVRLGACAKAPPPNAGAGQPITDSKTLSATAMMTAIIGAGAEVAASEGKGEAAAPVIWCAERAMPAKPLSVLLWRGVYADGSDAAVDQVTAAGDKLWPAITVAPDTMANLVESQKTPTNNWVATMVGADQTTSVYGYFTGRPASVPLATLYLQALTGQTHPLISYGAKGKSITIGLPSTK